MAEDTPDDEKTEEATARRSRSARMDKFHDLRNSVLPLMISSMSALYLMGGWLIGNLADLFALDL